MKILNFGSCNIDYVYSVDHIVNKGETIASDALHIFSGGKGLNQSIALSKAGAEVYHAGAIGEDGFFLKNMLEESGVNTDYLYIKAELRTGNAMIQRDKKGDNCIILHGGSNKSITKKMIDEVLCHFEKEDLLVLQNEINELPYLVTKAYELGMKIALNPSPMDKEIKKIPLEYINYFVLNEIEAKALTGETEEEKLADALICKFPKAEIVLTLGEKGSIYAKNDIRLEQKIYQVPVKDTTAAGDTFTGYFLASVMNGISIKESLNRASKASAIAVSRKGAAPSIPRLEEVI
ncbi:MAG: ribokinase [Acetivibrio sp.]